jgi:hypothetical protein
VKIDFLKSSDGTVYAINCKTDPLGLEVGVLCVFNSKEEVVTINNDSHRIIVELPSEFCTVGQKTKVFNTTLNILSHEQI